MDQFLSRLFNLQTDPGGAPEGGAPPAAAEPAAATGPAAAAPEPVAAPAPAGWDDPAFIAAVDQRAAEMFEHRMSALAGQQQQQPAAAAGPAPDLNELLSPLSESFGENLARFLADRDQFLLGQIGQQIQPILSREEQAQTAQGQQVMDEIVTAQWNPATDGPLSEVGKSAIKDLAPSYLPEMEQRYGAGPMAAQAALTKAAGTIRALNADARGAGGQANADQLAAVAAAAGEPGTGTGAIQVPPPAKDYNDVLARYFGGRNGGSAA